MNEFDLPALAADILDQRCVLLLGPEILRCNGQPVNAALAACLLENYARDIAHVYEREGLYKFPDEKAKKRVQTRALPEFFRDAKPDAEPLRQLLALPFHLVLQVTPDTFLSDQAHKHSVKHQARYFSGNGRAPDPVDTPTASAPLLYNLCGRHDRYDSMVLDFDDLYQYLKAVFSPPGLPQNLRTALDEATTFLFLGFQLDKWYTQLLIRWVSDVTGAERYANDYDFGENGSDIAEFVQKHLQVVPTGNAMFDLLNDLHAHFQKNKTLRVLGNPVSPNTATIRRLVENGDLDKALQTFHDIAPAVQEGETATMLLSQFHELKTAHQQYALTNEQFWEKSQHLKFRLLSTLEKHANAL